MSIMQENIDNAIQSVAEWLKEHPDLSFAIKADDYYVESTGQTGFMHEYDEHFKKYKYLKKKKKDGALSKEELRKCKEYNFGGVFGYSEYVEQLVKKSNNKITEEQAAIIELKHGTLENLYDYLQECLKEGTSFPAYFYRYDLNNIFKTCHDIDMSTNEGYDKVVENIMISKGYFEIFTYYSKNELNKELKKLDSNLSELIHLIFGLDRGEKPKSTLEVAKMLKRSRPQIIAAKERAFRKLRLHSRVIRMTFSLDTSNLSKEEQEELEKNVRTLRLPTTSRKEKKEANDFIKKYLTKKSLIGKKENSDNNKTEASKTTINIEETQEISSNNQEIKVDSKEQQVSNRELELLRLKALRYGYLYLKNIIEEQTKTSNSEEENSLVEEYKVLKYICEEMSRISKENDITENNIEANKPTTLH